MQIEGNVLDSIDFEFWFLQTLAMLLTALLIPNFTIKGPLSALFMVVSLAFVNAHVWSAALFLEVPDELTLRTLIVLLANGGIFWLLVKVLPGVETKGLLPSLVAPVVFTFCSLFIGKFGKEVEWGKVWNWTTSQVSTIRESLLNSDSPPLKKSE